MNILYIYLNFYTFRFPIKNPRSYVSNIFIVSCRVCRQFKRGAWKEEKRSKSGDRERTG